jgi:formylglycine-generating enzyme required for sulfatase activity
VDVNLRCCNTRVSLPNPPFANTIYLGTGQFEMELPMKAKVCTFYFLLTLLAVVNQAKAQVERFFRLVGPAATEISAFRADGTLIWTNGLPGTNYVVQTVSALPGGTDWVDYIQIPVTYAISTNQIVDFHPPSGMALIPAGSFTMGGTPDDWPTNGNWPPDPEIPAHTVYVSAFYMDVTDVTYALWQQVYSWAIMHGYSFDHLALGNASNYPAINNNWYDSVKWCNARSEMEGRTPVYYTDASQTVVYRTGDQVLSNSCVNWNGSGYRLPTEAEWEKAARGGLSGQRFPWGNTINESQANYNADPLALDTNGFAYDINTYIGYNTNFTAGNGTSPVAHFAPNGFGLYDMAGNVSQWCWDWLDPHWYTNAGALLNDPRGPVSSLYGTRELRGGDSAENALGVRCAYRENEVIHPSIPWEGFRCVRGL